MNIPCKLAFSALIGAALLGFSNSATSAGVTPPSEGPIPVQPKTIAAPTNLTWTDNVPTCVAHAGSGPIFNIPNVNKEPASCSQAIADGYKIMIWDWRPCHVACVAAVDGFTVYSNGARIGEMRFPTTALALQVSSGTVTPTPRCFQVRAYVNIPDSTIKESEPSNTFCGA